jgi:predicted metal-dependent hydrolase
MNNQRFIKLLFQWLLSQIDFGIAEITKLLRGNAREKLKDVRSSLKNARTKIKDYLAEMEDAKHKDNNVRLDWDEFLKNQNDKSELIFIADAELEEIMLRYSLKRRTAYNYRMRARVELEIVPPNKEYPKRKFHK